MRYKTRGLASTFGRNSRQEATTRFTISQTLWDNRLLNLEVKLVVYYLVLIVSVLVRQ